MPVRAVFDCMLFLQAVTNGRGAAFKCFQLAEDGRVTLLVSRAVIAEVQDVLNRPELCRRFKRLTPERSTAFLERVMEFAELCTEPPKAFTLPRDPDDELYTDLTVAGGADYLVTWNQRHLTYLMERDTPEGRDFCQRFPGLTILDPVSFIRRVEPPPAPEVSKG